MVQKGGYISKKKGAKKGTKKKPVDTFSKKEWFDLRVPSFFSSSVAGKTLVTRTTAKQNIDKLVIGRCFEVNQGDLEETTDTFRKFKFIVTDVNNREANTEFYNMRITNDKLRGCIKKYHALIEGDCLAETTDGYVLRFFIMAQSKRPAGYTKSRVHVQSTKVRKIRQKMFEAVEKEVRGCDMNEVVKKLCCESIGKLVEETSFEIFPIHNCHVKKVMVVKRPKKLKEVEQEVIIEEGEW